MVITPEQLAAIAVAQLEVPVPEIGITPEPGPGRMATVGVPVWLWTPPAIWEPQSATAALGGLSVTATSELAYVAFDMGDGNTVTCTSSGTPYQDSFGLTDSPDCGHTYEQTSAEQSGLEYAITATAHYEVVWTGAATGSDELVATSGVTPMPVGEYQVVITG